MICFGIEALDHRAALAADQVEIDGLALGDQLLGLAAGGADDVGVERAGEAAVARCRRSSRWVWSLPVPASSFGLCGPSVTLAARLGDHRRHALGIGTRRPRRACCARRSLAAATIFIALVIFWVDLTERDPDLECLEAGHLSCSVLRLSPASTRSKCLREIADERVLQLGGGVVVERLGVADRRRARRHARCACG